MLIGIVRVMFIDWDRKQAELGIYLGNKADRGRGYGSRTFKKIIEYMFNEKHFARLYLKVSVKNLQAIKSYRRIGFKKEDDLEDNVVIMAIYNKEL